MTLLHLGNTVLNTDHVIRADYDNKTGSAAINSRLEITVLVDAASPTNVIPIRGSDAEAMWHALTALAVDVQGDYDIHLHELHLQEQEAQHTRPLFREGMDVDPEILRNQGWQRALANFLKKGGVRSGSPYVRLTDVGGYSYHDELPRPIDFCVTLRIPELHLDRKTAEDQMWADLTEEMHRRMTGQ